MAIDSQILDIFVAQALGKPKVAELTANWRIDPKKIEEAVCTSLRDIGVLTVPKGHEELIIQTIIAHLKHSPDLVKMVRKAQKAHAIKNVSRHSEG